MSVRKITWTDDVKDKLHYTNKFEACDEQRHTYGIRENMMMFVKKDVPYLDIFCRCISKFTNDDCVIDVHTKHENNKCMEELMSALEEHLRHVHKMTSAGTDTLVFEKCGKIDIYCRLTVKVTDSDDVMRCHVAWLETLGQMLETFLCTVHESEKERHAKSADVRLCTTNVDVNSLSAEEQNSFLQYYKNTCMHLYGRLVDLEFIGCGNNANRRYSIQFDCRKHL